MTQEPKIGRPLTRKERAAFDRIVAEHAETVRELNARPRRPPQVDQEALAQANAVLDRARRSLRKLEMRQSLAREKGEAMSEAFWAAFGKAVVSVRLAERAVASAGEAR